MQLARFRSNRVRAAVLALSVGAAVHFAVSCLIWGRFLVDFLRDPSPPWRRFLLEGGPAGLLLLWFIAAAVLAWRRLRVSAVALLLGMLVAGSLFVHDAATHNWQLHAESYVRRGNEQTFFYFTWWWYDQRWLERIGW